jgi:hypothetical protein
MEDTNKDYFIKLTVAVYRITDLLPQEEPLRNFIRQKANDLVADFVIISEGKSLGWKVSEPRSLLDRFNLDWEVLKAYFELAKTQQWLKSENFDVLRREYGKWQGELSKEVSSAGQGLGEEVAKRKNPVGQVTGPRHLSSSKLMLGDLNNNRHKKIVEILKNKGTAQVKDIKEFFPQLSKRTLRRDFEYLLHQGVVARMGDGNMTVYKLK